MRRHCSTLIALSTLGFLAFVCGCGKSNDQGTQARPEAAKTGENRASDTNTPGPVTSSGEATPGSSAAEGQFAGAGQFTLAGAAKPTDLFERTAPKSHQTVVSSDGTVYEGEVKGGTPHGIGVMTDARGTREEGEWRDGQVYRARGTWVAWDGTKEEGVWNLDGSKSGGTIVWPDGHTYKGDWKSTPGNIDQPDGEGTMNWPDGRKYVGEFNDGLMEGRGTMTYPDRKIEEGVWKQGKFVGPAK